MTCDRCKKTVSVVVNCEIKARIGVIESTVRKFGVCPECASDIPILLVEAVNDVVPDA